METLRRSIHAQRFTEKIATKGRRESTKRVYDVFASHLVCRWCAARTLDHYTAPVTSKLSLTIVQPFFNEGVHVQRINDVYLKVVAELEHNMQAFLYW